MKQRADGLLREFWSLVAEKRIEEAIRLLDPEGSFWARPMGSIPMRAFFEILRSVQREVPMTFTYRNEIKKASCEMLEMESHGKFEKTGEPYNNCYVFVAEVRDGKIVVLREYSDTEYANDSFGRNLSQEAMATIAVHFR